MQQQVKTTPSLPKPLSNSALIPPPSLYHVIFVSHQHPSVLRICFSCFFLVCFLPSFFLSHPHVSQSFAVSITSSPGICIYVIRIITLAFISSIFRLCLAAHPIAPHKMFLVLLLKWWDCCMCWNSKIKQLVRNKNMSFTGKQTVLHTKKVRHLMGQN